MRPHHARAIAVPRWSSRRPTSTFSCFGVRPDGDVPQGTAPTEGVALDITPDGAGGYVFCGFAGDSTLNPSGDPKAGLGCAMNGALEVTWATQVDSPNPPGAEDYDGFSHVLALPSGDVFLSGSSNTQDCLQEASAVMLNGPTAT